MARIIGEVRPRYVFVENSPILTSRGLGVVLGDLASLGYNAKWGVLGAHHAGFNHKRDRIWILADSVKIRHENTTLHNKRVSKVLQKQTPKQDNIPPALDGLLSNDNAKLLRVPNGLAGVVDRIAAIGNGQVPAVVRLAWETLNSV
jgi:DNA (cytosine-5)-methyltransferase 1